MSCNYYADMGYDDALGMYRKSRVVLSIEQALVRQQLTVARAATLFGITEARLTKLLEGQFRDEELALLVRFLKQLGHTAIFTEPDPASQSPGEFHLIPPILVQ